MFHDVFIPTGKGVDGGSPSLLHCCLNLKATRVAEKLPHLTQNIWTGETDRGAPVPQGPGHLHQNKLPDSCWPQAPAPFRGLHTHHSCVRVCPAPRPCSVKGPPVPAPPATLVRSGSPPGQVTRAALCSAAHCQLPWPVSRARPVGPQPAYHSVPPPFSPLPPWSLGYFRSAC